MKGGGYERSPEPFFVVVQDRVRCVGVSDRGESGRARSRWHVHPRASRKIRGAKEGDTRSLCCQAGGREEGQATAGRSSVLAGGEFPYPCAGTGRRWTGSLESEYGKL